MVTRSRSPLKGIIECPTCYLPTTQYGYSNYKICSCGDAQGVSCACKYLGTKCKACSRPKFWGGVEGPETFTQTPLQGKVR